MASARARRSAATRSPFLMRCTTCSEVTVGSGFCDQPNAEHLLFATRNGRPYTTNKVAEYRLYPLLKKLGIPQCGLNGFRHTCQLATDGGSITDDCAETASPLRPVDHTAELRAHHRAGAA